MNSIAIAEQRYNDIITTDFSESPRAERYWSMPVCKIGAWISEYVLPAIDELYQRPLFREHATWSGRVLSSSADTPERRAVDRVDRALVDAASALRKLANNRLVRRRLQELKLEASDSKVSGRRGGESASRLTTTADHRFVDHYVSQLENMAQRPWDDLVCVHDFLGPVNGMYGDDILSSGGTEGAFLVSLQPNLFFVGDMIVRSMFQRISCWSSILAEARSVIYDALARCGTKYRQQVELERSSWPEVQASQAALKGLCTATPDSRLRDAATTAMQVHAEFHPSPDLQWLAIAPWVVDRFKGRLRHSIEGTREIETLQRISSALGELRHLYRGMNADVAAQDEAISTGNLVIVDLPGRRDAYWQRNRIDADWFKFNKPWKMLVALVRKAPVGASVGGNDLYGDGGGSSTISNRSLRLKRLLPKTLRGFVQPGERGSTSYRLTLDNHRVYLFAAPLQSNDEEMP